MKLFSGFVKELKIASRGFYFYIELFLAVLILVVFLWLVPNNFSDKGTEYIYLDMPEQASELYVDDLLKEDLDGTAELVTLEIDNDEKEARLYSLESKDIYLVNSREDVIYMAETEREVAAAIKLDEDNAVQYEYFLQGYESDKYKNLLKVLHVESNDVMESTIDSQEVRSLGEDVGILSDRENMIPSVLVFNGSLMGLFIIAAYIFLDRKEGVITAYAVTPSPVWQYLMSKIGVIMVTSIVSSFLVLIPIMGAQPDYLLLTLLLITTAFFSSSLGLLIASFYKNIMQAFGAIYGFMLLMILPNIAYFLPSWNPAFIKWIPTYPMLEGFKSTLLGSGEWAYILSVSGGFLLAGMVLFGLANRRYKKTLLG